jgi:predicted metal-dependent phosphoesterase TrpH
MHFLGRGQLFYEQKAALPVDEAISLLHAGGGLAIVAHPMSLQLSFDDMETKFGLWKELGLDGVEAWHPGAEPRYCRRLEKLAHRWGLKVSAGSDFHGDNRPDRALGLTSGARPIDEGVLEALFA